jgi:hypothetical protein
MPGSSVMRSVPAYLFWLSTIRRELGEKNLRKRHEKKLSLNN